MTKLITIKLRKSYHLIYCPHLGKKECVSNGVVNCFDKLLKKHSLDYRRCPEYKKLPGGNKIK